MTQEQLFRKLRRKKWHIEWDGKIRCDDGRCPLGAADADIADVPSARGAAQLLGLPLIVARKIATAADHDNSRHRPWLLEKLGLA